MWPARVSIQPISFLSSRSIICIAYYEAGSVPAQITWDDEFVGEVARTAKACAVFLFFPFYWLCACFLPFVSALC